MSCAACTSSRRDGRQACSWRRSRYSGASDDEEFLQAFAGTDRAVSDFLVTEVLAGLPPELVEFLVRTSVLDVFDAELCTAVTGIEESKALLDHLLAANLFIVSLDERALVPLSPPVRSVSTGAAGIVGSRQASGSARSGVRRPGGSWG